MKSGRRPRDHRAMSRAAVYGGIVCALFMGSLGMPQTSRAEDPVDDEGPLMPHRPHPKLAELFPGEIVDGARCRQRGGRWIVQGEG